MALRLHYSNILTKPGGWAEHHLGVLVPNAPVRTAPTGTGGVVPADLRKRWRKANCQSWSSRPDTLVVRRSRLERFSFACGKALLGQAPESELPRGSADPLHAARRCGPDTLHVNSPSVRSVLQVALDAAALRGSQRKAHRLRSTRGGRGPPHTLTGGLSVHR